MRLLTGAATFAWLGLLLLPARGFAEPQIRDLSLYGLQSGGTTVITVRGTDLLPEPQLVLPVPVAQQQLEEGATNEQVRIALTLDEAISPGIYPARLVNAKGVSNSLLVGIDDLPQRAFEEPVEALPIALHGQVRGGEILTCWFEGLAGQRFVADLESRRLGAALRGVVRLYGPDKTQIAWSPPQAALMGDARLETVLPVDGKYTIELHDRLYRAAAPGFFRLKLGSLNYVDLAFPAGVALGGQQPLQLWTGSLPEKMPATIDTGGLHNTSILSAPLPALAGMTGNGPRVLATDLRQVVEQSDAVTMAGEAPAALHGVLSESDQVDRFQLQVASGSKLRVVVYADRLGAPLDAVVTVTDKNGKQLARGDDGPMTTDPELQFDVPADCTEVIVAIQDLLHRGGESFVYTVAVEDVQRPEFSLQVADDHFTLPRDACTQITVSANRRGYGGPIDLEFEGLPAEAVIHGDKISAGTNLGLVTVMIPESVTWHGSFSVIGRGQRGEQAIVRQAANSSVAGSSMYPWWGWQMVAATGETAPLRIEWQDELQQPATFHRGMTTHLPIRLHRREGVVQPVRLRLVSAQPMPKKTVKKDDKDEQVDDTDRALRLAEGEPMLESAVTETSVKLHIPPDLADRVWQFTLVAELLSDDKKTVLASAACPTRSFRVADPLQLQVATAGPWQVRAGDGDTVTVEGSLQRQAGFDFPVTLTLEGLPDKVAAPQLEVAGDQTTFSWQLRLAADAPAGALQGVKLVATAKTNTEGDEPRVRSNTIDVQIEVVK